MASAFRSGGSYARQGSDSEGSRRGVTDEAYSDVGPMSEELSEDGAYSSAAGAALDGPAAWTDVDQEEVTPAQPPDSRAARHPRLPRLRAERLRGPKQCTVCCLRGEL